MDAFKLLSRSTKLPRNSVGTNGLSRTLPRPSDDVVSDLRQSHISKTSRKRKRNTQRLRSEEQEEGKGEAFLHPEINFFHNHAGIQDGVSTNAQGGALQPDEAAAEDGEIPSYGGDSMELDAGPISEDESKRILKSHKIKITKIWPREVDLTERDSKPRKKKNRIESKPKENGESKNKRSRKGLDIIPAPLTSFTQLTPRYGIDTTLARNIAAQGYVTPTEVQLSALPLLLDRHEEPLIKRRVSQASDVETRPWDLHADLMAVAPTGGGKTLAFLTPIINAIAHQKLAREQPDGHSNGPLVGPSAIILAPTKELAVQILLEARKLCVSTGISVSRPRKGMILSDSLDRQQQQITPRPDTEDVSDSVDEVNSEDEGGRHPPIKSKRACKAPDILVSAPLSLVNAIDTESGAVKSLDSVRYLVLDEADVLLDPMFRAQTLKVWSACSYFDLRVSLWSATMASSIESLATTTILDRRRQLLASDKPQTPHSNSYAPLIRLVVGLKDSAIPSSIDHRLTYCANEAGKLLALRQLLRSPPQSFSTATKPVHPPFLIFAQTIPRAIALASELKYDIPTPISALSTTEKSTGQPHSRIAVLHADLRPSTRNAIMARFRTGEIWLLITTDLLARGVDFAGVNAVINYDLPTSSAAYVHRVGRTGRTVRHPHVQTGSVRNEARRAGVAITFVADEDMPHLRNVVNVIEGAERAAKAQAKPSSNGLVEDQARESEDGPASSSIKQWMLTSLPKPTKREKQTLKKRGVEARRTVSLKDKATASSSKERAKALKNRFQTRISTKSGYGRRVERRRKDAAKAGKIWDREILDRSE